MELRQFKFANNEEIICEVLEWNTEDDDLIVVRKAMKIVSMDDPMEELRYYTFKPWISMNNDPDLIQTVNSYHIVAENVPSEMAMKTYYEVIGEMRKFAEEQDHNDLDDLNDGDSDQGSNVVQFNKKILH